MARRWDRVGETEALERMLGKGRSAQKGRKWKNNDGFWKQFYDSKFVRKWDRPEGELNNDLPL